jgi:hypothetical protein
VLALGGEPYTHLPSACKRLEERWKSGQLRLFNLYGITELSVVRVLQVSPLDNSPSLLQWASCLEVTTSLWESGGLDAVRRLVPMADTNIELRSDGLIWLGSTSGVRTCLIDHET